MDTLQKAVTAVIAVAIVYLVLKCLGAKEHLTAVQFPKLGKTNDLNRDSTFVIGQHRQNYFTMDAAATRDAGQGAGQNKWVHKSVERSGASYTNQDSGMDALETRKVQSAFGWASNANHGIPTSQQDVTIFGFPNNHIAAAGLANFHNTVEGRIGSRKDYMPKPSSRGSRYSRFAKFRTSPSFRELKQVGNPSLRSKVNTVAVAEKQTQHIVAVRKIVTEVNNAAAKAAVDTAATGASQTAVLAAANNAAQGVLQRATAKALDEQPLASPVNVMVVVKAVPQIAAAAAAKSAAVGKHADVVAAETHIASAVVVAAANKGVSFKA